MIEKHTGRQAAEDFADARLLTLDEDGDQPSAAQTLTSDGPRPVIVILGGAAKLSARHRNQLMPLIDRGVAAAAERANAVVVTGGTQSGIMELVGALLKDRPGVTTVGVAPRALVTLPGHRPDTSSERGHVNPGGEDPDHSPESVLDPNHDFFVLTPGHTWGSETETMFSLAEQLTAGNQAGVVILANGGATARRETLRFVKAGWPTICVAGSGREADVLAALTRRRLASRRQMARAFGWARVPKTEWGDLGSSDIELHSVGATPELLFRRLSWRLSDQTAVKNAWSRWASFDQSADRGRKLTNIFQLAVLALTVLLVVLSVLYSRGEFGHRVRPLIVTLPVAVALSSALSEALLPARNWTTLRAGAEATRRAIYRYWCRAGPGTLFHADVPVLTQELAQIDQFVLRSGVPLAIVTPIRSRPDRLPTSFDELGQLTVRAYSEERLEDQLRYYRSTAVLMRIRETVAIASSAVLAAAATALAADFGLAIWVPLLVFLASTVTILQQRSRWHDRIRLYGLTVAELEVVRGRSVEKPVTGRAGLIQLVDSVEAVLEREQSGWLQNMRRVIDESQRYHEPQLGEFK